MRKHRLLLRLVLCALCFAPCACFAQEVISSTELIEQAKKFDQQAVIYEGEVIGEVMTRRENSWVNLNDGLNALGIWIPNNFLNLISFAGGYDAKGDYLKIKGVYNRACSLHGGDLDIHALEVTKIRDGRKIKHPLVPEKQKLVIILAGVLLCLLIGQLLKQRLSRK